MKNHLSFCMAIYTKAQRLFVLKNETEKDIATAPLHGPTIRPGYMFIYDTLGDGQNGYYNNTTKLFDGKNCTILKDYVP